MSEGFYHGFGECSYHYECTIYGGYQEYTPRPICFSLPGVESQAPKLENGPEMSASGCSVDDLSPP